MTTAYDIAADFGATLVMSRRVSSLIGNFKLGQ
jgi:hypothetical protein